MTIRPYRDEDRQALYEVCLRTGADGDDASGLYREPELLGEVYVGPYLTLAPELALVAEDATGVGGYALAAADTRAFEAECEASWWPPLRRRYPLTAYGDGSPDAGIVAAIHRPTTAPDDLVGRFPAHVHIDLLPRFQGRGYGRRMLSRLFDTLATRGVPGVHLGVSPRNDRAIGFYRHLGMAEHGSGDDELIMTLALPFIPPGLRSSS